MPANKIELHPSGDDKCSVIYPEPFTELNGHENTAALRKLLQREPYNLPAVMALADQLFEAGNIEEACRIRFDGCQTAVKAVPDDEDPIPVDWDEGEPNQAFVSIFGAAGLDFYYNGDFEMAAALFETTLDLDPEDHFEATVPLAYSYTMLDEWELLDEVLFDIPEDSMDRRLINALALYKKGEKFDPERALGRELLAELRMENHPEPEGKIFRTDKPQRLSKEEQARILWFRTQHIITASEGFTDSLR